MHFKTNEVLVQDDAYSRWITCKECQIMWKICEWVHKDSYWTIHQIFHMNVILSGYFPVPSNVIEVYQYFAKKKEKDIDAACMNFWNSYLELSIRDVLYNWECLKNILTVAWWKKQERWRYKWSWFILKFQRNLKHLIHWQFLKVHDPMFIWKLQFQSLLKVSYVATLVRERLTIDTKYKVG